jgi:hypothetical protein
MAKPPYVLAIFHLPFPIRPSFFSGLLGSKRQVSIDGGNRAGWRRDGKELYYTSLDGKLMAAEVRPGARFQVGAPKPFLATRISLASRYDVASDGRFVMVQLHPEAVSPPITVVFNWPATLKK